jgi:5'-3' exonuclease
VQSNIKLLVDFSNIIYSVFFLDLRTEGIQDENFVRHLCLNKILSIKRKLNISYKNMFLLLDHKINSRRQIYSYYKAGRAKAREESNVDFQKLFRIIDELYIEMKTHVPFYVLRNEYIEADDWIAVLTKHFSETKDPVIVVSTDKDFYQLQKYPNVLYQYDHLNFKPVRVENAENVLKVKVLCGDPGDGIPNILSDDDTFVTEGKRQKPFGEKKAWKNVIDNTVDKLIEENNLQTNFKRNDRLINFDKIPKQISDAIIQRYVTYRLPSDGTMLEAYLHSKKLNIIASKVREFFE